MSRLYEYLKAMRPHLNWYLMCGPLAVWEVLDPVLQFYGIQITRYVPSRVTTPVLVLFACFGIFYAGFLVWDQEHTAREAAQRPERTAGPRILSGLFDPERRGTIAMERLAEEMRHQRNQTASEYSEREIVKLLAFHERGTQLFQMALTTNDSLYSWIASFKAWRRELLEALHPTDRAALSLPLSDSQRTAGHSGALNREHGDAKGQILIDLEKLTKIVNQRYL
jgi:hypothetical protein